MKSQGMDFWCLFYERDVAESEYGGKNKFIFHAISHFFFPNFLQKEVKDEQLRGEENKIKAAIGFRHVIDLLSSEKKLIVGHNCFLGKNYHSKFHEEDITII